MRYTKLCAALFFLTQTSALAQQAQLGKSNWIFPTAWEYHPGVLTTSNSDIEQSLRIVNLVNKALKSRGTTLIMAAAPAKMRVYPEFLPDKFETDEKFISRYSRIQSALRAQSVVSVDLYHSMINAKSLVTEDLYIPQDSHWSPSGAIEAGQAIAKVIQQLHLDRDIPTFKITRTKLSPVDRRGDLLNVLTSEQTSQYKGTVDHVSGYSFEKTGGSLLGDDTPQIVLTGSSYSGDDFQLGNSIGYSLQHDVLTVWKPALGQWKAIVDYTGDDSFQSMPPKILVWDLIEREWDMPPMVSSLYQKSNHYYAAQLLANIYNRNGINPIGFLTLDAQPVQRFTVSDNESKSFRATKSMPKYSYLSFTYISKQEGQLNIQMIGENNIPTHKIDLRGDGQPHRVNIPFLGDQFEGVAFQTNEKATIDGLAIYQIPFDIDSLSD